MRRNGEPRTINAQAIAEFLDARQMPRMAQFVRNFEASQRYAAERESALREAYQLALQRLRQHEPQQYVPFEDAGVKRTFD